MMKKYSKYLRTLEDTKIIIVSSLILITFWILVTSSLHKSLSADEPLFIEGGSELVRNSHISYHSGQPPLISYMIGLSHSIYESLTGGRYVWLTNLPTDLLLSRIPIMLVSLALGYGIYYWSEKRYGTIGGLLALILYLTTPIILGNSNIATTDILVSASVFITIMFFWNLGRWDEIKTKRSKKFELKKRKQFLIKLAHIIVVAILYYLLIIVTHDQSIRSLYSQIPANGWAAKGFDDSSWEEVDRYYYSKNSEGFFRVYINSDENKDAKFVIHTKEGSLDEIYVNGVEYPLSDIPFSSGKEAKYTPVFSLLEGENVIAIRIKSDYGHLFYSMGMEGDNPFNIILSLFSILSIVFLAYKYKVPVFVGILSGISILAKVSGFMTIPMIGIILFFMYMNRRVSLERSIIYMSIVCLVANLVLNLGYGFAGVNVHSLRRIPIPASNILLNNVDHLYEIIEGGHSSYLMGRVSSTGFWYYYIIAFLIKNPIPLLILISFSLIHYIRGLGSDWVENEELLFLLLPIFLIFTYYSIFVKMNLGIRYILPLYPFIFFFCGRLAKIKNPVHQRLIIIMVIAQIIVLITSYPHYMEYFNELIGGSSKGYLYLSDSNLDWGQNLHALAEFTQENNVVCGPLFGPWPSNIRCNQIDCWDEESVRKFDGYQLAVSSFSLTVDRQCTWLLDHQPSSQIGYSILLYDVSKL
jgi:hypothetical protein